MQNSTEKGFTVIEGLLILATIGLISLTGWYIWSKHNSQNQNLVGPATGVTVNYTGTLASMDLSQMGGDGPGVYKIKLLNQELIVHLDAGESSCDRKAITAPDVKVGDVVQVKGNRDSAGVVLVCNSGSYIK